MPAPTQARLRRPANKCPSDIAAQLQNRNKYFRLRRDSETEVGVIPLYSIHSESGVRPARITNLTASGGSNVRSFKEDEVSILDAILRRREPVAAYRTVDGGHPAPYPDMTDEQLYNYEIAFNVPKKTFDKPPSSAATRKREAESKARTNDRTFAQAPPAAGRHEPQLQDDDEFDMPASSARTAGNDAPREEARVPQPAPAPDDMPPLDLSKPVRTVTTRQPVEIITTRARHPIYKVHGYIDDDNIVTVFTLNGQLSEHGPRFLENVPEKRELHLNIYPNHNAGGREKYIVTQHDTREEADAAATSERIACVKAEFNT
jgi:hypothetical protein